MVSTVTCCTLIPSTCTITSCILPIVFLCITTTIWRSIRPVQSQPCSCISCDVGSPLAALSTAASLGIVLVSVSHALAPEINKATSRHSRSLSSPVTSGSRHALSLNHWQKWYLRPRLILAMGSWFVGWRVWICRPWGPAHCGNTRIVESLRGWTHSSKVTIVLSVGICLKDSQRNDWGFERQMQWTIVGGLWGRPSTRPPWCPTGTIADSRLSRPIRNLALCLRQGKGITEWPSTLNKVELEYQDQWVFNLWTRQNGLQLSLQ